MKSTTTVPYFKHDTGQFLADTLGYSLLEVGVYSKLMAIYWEHGCKLPPEVLLMRKLQVTTKKEREALQVVLDSFFPGGIHEHLDLCLKEAKAFSKVQSDRVSKRYTKPEPSAVQPEDTTQHEDAPVVHESDSPWDF